MISSAQRDGYALHEGVIVVLKDQGWPDDLWMAKRVQQKIFLPTNASERFSTSPLMSTLGGNEHRQEELMLFCHVSALTHYMFCHKSHETKDIGCKLRFIDKYYGFAKWLDSRRVFQTIDCLKICSKRALPAE